MVSIIFYFLALMATACLGSPFPEPSETDLINRWRELTANQARDVDPVEDMRFPNNESWYLSDITHTHFIWLHYVANEPHNPHEVPVDADFAREIAEDLEQQYVNHPGHEVLGVAHEEGGGRVATNLLFEGHENEWVTARHIYNAVVAFFRFRRQYHPHTDHFRVRVEITENGRDGAPVHVGEIHEESHYH